MIRLTESLRTWGTPDFETVLKHEIEQLDAGQLPLQAGLARSSHVHDAPFSVMIIGVSEDATHLRVRAGIFYSGIIAGCNCADDPTPVDAQAEYCVVRFDIDKPTGNTAVTLTPE